MNISQYRDTALKHLTTTLFSTIIVCGVVVAWLNVTHRYPTYTELIIFTILCTIAGTLIILRIQFDAILTVLLIVSHLSLFVIWGSAVPFLHFLPFVIAFLLAKQNHQGIYYLLFSLFMELTELVGIFPLAKLEVNVGFINVVIILVLQLVTYAVFALLLELFSDFNTISVPGTTSGGKKSLSYLLLQGLYSSLLMHFTNNVINAHLWAGASATLAPDTLLELFARSNNPTTEKLPLTLLLKTLADYFAHSKDLALNLEIPKTDISLTYTDFQLILITLFDLITNYYKHGKYESLMLYTFQKPEAITFQLEGKTTQVQQRNVTVGRHLGKLSLFLKLSQKGTVSIRHAKNDCITTLTLHL